MKIIVALYLCVCVQAWAQNTPHTFNKYPVCADENGQKILRVDKPYRRCLMDLRIGKISYDINVEVFPSEDGLTGIGEIVWPSGVKYFGQIKSGLPFGKGSVYFPEKWPLKSYVGEFSNELSKSYSTKDIDAIRKHNSSLPYGHIGNYSLYMLEFSINLISGEGQLNYRDGTEISGVFNEGFMILAKLRNSLPPCQQSIIKHLCWGEITAKNNNGDEFKYVGKFKDGKIDGLGYFLFNDGLDWYVGEHRNGSQNGYGAFSYRTGETYIGEFKDGKLSGRGVYSYNNGIKYVGEYSDNLRNGNGVEYKRDGTVNRSGRWSRGELISPFVINSDLFHYHADILLTAEAWQSDKRKQELEERLAQERTEKERLAAQVASQASAPQLSSPLATGRNERRVALIVGNSKYANNPLDNPVNDAADLDAALKNLGFKTTLLRDANITQMRNATRQFSDDVASSDVALIFFAGHGIEAKGRNYLIPVSADIKHEYELEDQAYDAGRWLDMLENIKGTNKQRVNIVILDACRNNDLSRGWRSASRGLARMDAPTGTFIAFATAPGKVAMDGAKGQRNSPFTKNLLRTIQTPDLPIELMFKEVRRQVLEDTKNEQTPWDNSSLVGDFVFKRSR